MVKTYARGAGEKLAPNFVAREWDCPHTRGCGCTETLVDSDLVSLLQQIRDHFGKAVNVLSGYRCPAHNAAVDGAKNSYHMRGQAADIRVSGITPTEVAQYAETLGAKGIILYRNKAGDRFVHIDTRPTRYWAIDDTTVNGGRAYSVKTFGGEMDPAAPVRWAVKRLLRYRSPRLRGDDVRELQTRLIARGISCGKYGADGDFGLSTHAAVKTFQRQAGLYVDGKAGKNTIGALGGVWEG